MKRLAVLTLAACLGGAAAGRAADPLPLPTGFAPTAPRVPAPAVKNGVVVPVVVPVAATAAPAAGAVQLVGFQGAGIGKLARGPQVWCSDCAPAVPTPLPPAPAGAACAGGACAPATGGHDGHCWARFKDWFCFRNTPYHFGFTPTPRITPFYTYFPCVERAGCAGGNCGPGGCAAPGRVGGGLIHGAGRADPGCRPCPQPGEAVMPGFRFATPTGTPAAAPPAVPECDVQPSAFRTPAGQPLPGVRPAGR